jgi:hypothetical protein
MVSACSNVVYRSTYHCAHRYAVVLAPRYQWRYLVMTLVALHDEVILNVLQRVRCQSHSETTDISDGLRFNGSIGQTQTVCTKCWNGGGGSEERDVKMGARSYDLYLNTAGYEAVRFKLQAAIEVPGAMMFHQHRYYIGLLTAAGGAIEIVVHAAS